MIEIVVKDEKIWKDPLVVLEMGDEEEEVGIKDTSQHIWVCPVWGLHGHKGWVRGQDPVLSPGVPHCAPWEHRGPGFVAWRAW